MFEAAFRFQHGCAVNKLSQLHPTVPMAQWCNFAIEVLEVHTADPKLADRVVEDLGRIKGKGFQVLARSTAEASTQMALLRCKHTPTTSVDGTIERHGCLYLPPVVYREGWEHYRVVAPTEDALRDTLRALGKRGKVELLSKKPLRGHLTGRALLVHAEQLLGDLTAKQAQALLAAIEQGYYRVPRRVRTEDIARRRHVPRTTFEEHVRKAESKVLNAMAPYVALYAGAS